MLATHDGLGVRRAAQWCGSEDGTRGEAYVGWRGVRRVARRAADRATSGGTRVACGGISARSARGFRGKNSCPLSFAARGPPSGGVNGAKVHDPCVHRARTGEPSPPNHSVVHGSNNAPNSLALDPRRARPGGGAPPPSQGASTRRSARVADRRGRRLARSCGPSQTRVAYARPPGVLGLRVASRWTRAII